MAYDPDGRSNRLVSELAVTNGLALLSTTITPILLQGETSSIGYFLYISQPLLLLLHDR
ncbi:MAG: hypothetical protein ACI8VE_002532, partial [Natrialbaceae archaeon]